MTLRGVGKTKSCQMWVFPFSEAMKRGLADKCHLLEICHSAHHVFPRKSANHLKPRLYGLSLFKMLSDVVCQWYDSGLYFLVVTQRGPQWRSGNTLISQLWGLWFSPRILCGKVGSCLPMVGSLQYRILTGCMYWFPLLLKLPFVIWP